MLDTSCELVKLCVITLPSQYSQVFPGYLSGCNVLLVFYAASIIFGILSIDVVYF